MEMSMAPPAIPGFSLRVKLFAPQAAKDTDRPVRCFRVVIPSNATIREFCEEASRIHDVNYGEPIAVKKCMDDELFDVTQSDEVSTLFTNMATIRIVQASEDRSMRDSVPPSSALRWEPANFAGRKRDRTVETSGYPQSNKRRRMSGLDQEHLVPSFEVDEEAIQNNEQLGAEILPRSAGSSRRAPRDVRDESPRVSETPSPAHSPALHSPLSEKRPTDFHGKSAHTFIPETSPQLGATNSFNNNEASQPLTNGERAKSDSHRTQRATERGKSVSTSTAIPLPTDLPAQNGSKSTNKQNISEPTPARGPKTKRPMMSLEDENIESDGEGSDTQKRPLGGSKLLNSANLRMGRSNHVNTPLNGDRDRERSSHSGKLPLTPSSKQRQKQQDREKAETESQARYTAAQAAEKRKQEADKARQQEETRTAEEQQRQRKEKSRQKLEQDEIEQAKKAQEAESEQAEEAEKAEMEELEQDRLQRNREATEKAEQPKNSRGGKGQKPAATTKQQKAKEEVSKNSRSSLEAADKSTPSAIRPPSSTSLVPNGKKAAIKPPQAGGALTSDSPDTARGVGIESQMPLPKSRRLSTLEDSKEADEPKNPPAEKTPTIKPPTSKAEIKPPPRITSQMSSSTSASTSNKPVAKKSTTPKPESGMPTHKPILPPNAMEGSSSRTEQTIQKADDSASSRHPSDNSAEKINPQVVKKPILPPTATKKTAPRSSTPALDPDTKSNSTDKSSLPSADEETGKTDSGATGGPGKSVKEKAQARTSNLIMPPQRVLQQLRSRSSTPLRTASDAAAKVASKVAPPAKAAPLPSGKKAQVAKAGPSVSSSKKSAQAQQPDKAKPTGGNTPVQPIKISSESSELEESEDEEADAEQEAVEPVRKSAKAPSPPVIVKQELESEDDVFKDVESEADRARTPVVHGQSKKEEAASESSSSSSEESSSESSSDSDSDDAEVSKQQSGTGPVSQQAIRDALISSSEAKGNGKCKQFPKHNDLNNGEQSSSQNSLNTQDEVDQQLTSSMNDAASAFKSEPILPPQRSKTVPPSSAVQRSQTPKPIPNSSQHRSPSHSQQKSAPDASIPRFGASLSQLNRNKSTPLTGRGMLGSSQLSKSQTSASQDRLKNLQGSDDEESEEEEEESSDDDEEPKPPPTKKKAIETPKTSKKEKETKKRVQEESDDSEEEDEEEEDERRAASQLQNSLKMMVGKALGSSPAAVGKRIGSSGGSVKTKPTSGGCGNWLPSNARYLDIGRRS